MVSNASDSQCASVHTQPNLPVLSLLSLSLSHPRALLTCLSCFVPWRIYPPLPGSRHPVWFSLRLSSSCSRPVGPLVPCLGFTYLGHSSSTMSLCRYFRQRACLDEPSSYARLPTKMGAKAVSPRNPTANTARLVNEPAVAVDLSKREPRDRGQSVNGRSQSDYFPLFFFFLSFLSSSFWWRAVHTYMYVRCWRDGRLGRLSWLADWFYCSTTWSLVSLAVIVGSIRDIFSSSFFFDKWMDICLIASGSSFSRKIHWEMMSVFDRVWLRLTRGIELFAFVALNYRFSVFSVCGRTDRCSAHTH